MLDPARSTQEDEPVLLVDFVSVLLFKVEEHLDGDARPADAD